MKKESPRCSASFQAKEFLTVIGIIAICTTVIVAANILKNKDITVKGFSGNSGSSAVMTNSISVSGEGKVNATPDLVRISAGVSERARTTKEAQTKANEKLNQILSVLKDNKVSEKHIKTERLSFYPEYDWSNGERNLIGQRATQSLRIEIHGIQEDSEKVTQILDALGNVDGLELNSVNFDLEEKEALFTQAREKAFEKAKQKAQELAKMGGVKLLKPITISESHVNYNPPMFRNFAKAEMAMDSAVGGASSMPSGELEVSASISVVYGIE